MSFTVVEPDVPQSGGFTVVEPEAPVPSQNGTTLQSILAWPENQLSKLSPETLARLEGMVEPLTGRGLMNQPVRLINRALGTNIPEYTGVPLTQMLPESVQKSPSPWAGALMGATDVAGGLTDPNLLATLPAGASKLGMRLFQALMGYGAYEGTKQAREVMANPQATGADVARATVGGLANNLLAAGVLTGPAALRARQAVPPPSGLTRADLPAEAPIEPVMSYRSPVEAASDLLAEPPREPGLADAEMASDLMGQKVIEGPFEGPPPPPPGNWIDYIRERNPEQPSPSNKIPAWYMPTEGPTQPLSAGDWPGFISHPETTIEGLSPGALKLMGEKPKVGIPKQEPLKTIATEYTAPQASAPVQFQSGTTPPAAGFKGVPQAFVEQVTRKRIPEEEKLQRSAQYRLVQPDEIAGARRIGAEEPVSSMMRIGFEDPTTRSNKRGVMSGLKEFFRFVEEKKADLGDPNFLAEFRSWISTKATKTPQQAKKIANAVNALYNHVRPKMGEAPSPLAEKLQHYRSLRELGTNLGVSRQPAKQKTTITTESALNAVANMYKAGVTGARSARAFTASLLSGGVLRGSELERFTVKDLLHLKETGNARWYNAKAKKFMDVPASAKLAPLLEAHLKARGIDLKTAKPEERIFGDVSPDVLVKETTRLLADHGLSWGSVRATKGDWTGQKAMGEHISQVLGNTADVALAHYVQESTKGKVPEAISNVIGAKAADIVNPRAGESGGPGFTKLFTDLGDATIKSAEVVARKAYTVTQNAAHAVVEGLRHLKEKLGDKFPQYASAAREWLRSLFNPPVPQEGIVGGAARAIEANKEAGSILNPFGKGGEKRGKEEKRQETQLLKKGGEPGDTKSEGGMESNIPPNAQELRNVPKQKGGTETLGTDQAVSLDPHTEFLAREAKLSPSSEELPGLRTTFDQKKESLKTANTRPQNTRLSDPKIPLAEDQNFQTFRDKVERLTNAAVNTARSFERIIWPIDAVMDLLGDAKGEYKGWLFENVRKPLDYFYNLEKNLVREWGKDWTDMASKIPTKQYERGNVWYPVWLSKREGGKYIDRLEKSGISRELLARLEKELTPTDREHMRIATEITKRTADPIARTLKEAYDLELKREENYAPMQVDRAHKAFDPAEVPAANLGKEPTMDDVIKRLHDEMGIVTSAERGFTKPTATRAVHPIRLNGYDVMDTFLRDAAHFTANEAYLRNIAKIIRSHTAQEKFGNIGQKTLIDWLSSYATQGRNRNRVHLLDVLRKNTTQGVIAMRVASQFVHLSAIPSVWFQITRTGRTPQEAASMWWDAVTDTMKPETNQWLRKNLAESFERGGGEPAQVEAGAGHGKYNAAVRAGFSVVRWIDQHNTQAASIAIYKSLLDKKGKNGDAYLSLPVDRPALAEAYIRARRAVASPLYKDVPLALSKGGSIPRTFFQFQNVFLDMASALRLDVGEGGVRNLTQSKEWRPLVYGTLAALATLAVESGIKFGVQRGYRSAIGYEPAKQKEYLEKVEEEAMRRVPGAGQAMILATTLSRAAKGEQTDVRMGVPMADVLLGLGQKSYELKNALQEGEKSWPVTATQLGAAAAEMVGVPGSSQGAEWVGDYLKKQLQTETARTFAEKGGVKKLDQLPLSQRIKIARQLKTTEPPQTMEAKKREQIRGAQADFRRAEETLKSLPNEQQRWLRTNGLSPSGYKGSLDMANQTIPLSRDERERYRAAIQEELQKVIEREMQSGAMARLRPEMRQKRWAYLQKNAHQRAENRLKRSLPYSIPVQP